MKTASIDITREVCPMTWVRVKLAIESLQDGDQLEVILQGTEPLKNVPTNVRDDGHTVIEVVALDETRSRLLLTVKERK